jgi:outer membrane protein TolC
VTTLFEGTSEYTSVSASGSIQGLRAKHSYSIRIFLVAAACLLVGVVDTLAGPKPKLQPQAYGYFDFPTCVRYALVHSDSLLKNRIDIQLSGIDLKDAHSELLPTIQLITRYYLTRTGNNSRSGKINVQIFMTNWNPYLALLKIKSTGIMEDIAKISHIRNIGENVGNMAKLFYGISMLDKNIRANKQMIALENNKFKYAKNREQQQTVDELSLRSMANALKGRQVNLKRLQQEREEQIGKLKRVMGYHPDYYLPLDTRDAVNQILRGFNGASVTFADIQGSNLSLKILAKREQLRSNSVTGAYVSLLPRPVILAEGLSNEVDRASGTNLAFGLDYTLWDGFKRVRSIKKYKLQAQQAEIERKEASEDLYLAFKELRNQLGLASDRESVSREQAKIAELSEEKAFISYKAGATDYPRYMDSRVEKVQAQLDAANSSNKRVVTLIDLATMAGGLNKYNAGIRY